MIWDFDVFQDVPGTQFEPATPSRPPPLPVLRLKVAMLVTTHFGDVKRNEVGDSDTDKCEPGFVFKQGDLPTNGFIYEA